MVRATEERSNIGNRTGGHNDLDLGHSDPKGLLVCLRATTLSARCESLDELIEMSGQFAARLHFTPLNLGITLKLASIHILSEADSLTCESQLRERRELQEMGKRLGKQGERELSVSQQMYTQQRAYYESISDLFYLYDDFNDRQIHFNHAQMAGTEVALPQQLQAVKAHRSGSVHLSAITG